MQVLLLLTLYLYFMSNLFRVLGLKWCICVLYYILSFCSLHITLHIFYEPQESYSIFFLGTFPNQLFYFSLYLFLQISFCSLPFLYLVLVLEFNLPTKPFWCSYHSGNAFLAASSLIISVFKISFCMFRLVRIMKFF